VQLFVQRAQAVQPGFQLTEHNAEDVAEICRRLDGLPLAIELAAVRTKIFPVRTLRQRLSHRMVLLTGGARDMPERLQTMRRAIQWSYDLLSEREQELFHALSVFAGSFSFDAAKGIVDSDEGESDHDQVELLETLSSLLDKSFLVQELSSEGNARFRMLETIREFGLEQVAAAGEEEALRLRHLHYYATTAPGETDLAGPRQSLLLDQIDEDIPNIRFAMQTALDLGGEAVNEGLILASSMWRYWMSRGQFITGRRWLRSLLDRANAGDLMVRGRANNNLGNLVFELGDHHAARICYETAMEFYEAVGYLDGVADELNNLGLILVHEGDFDSAREAMQRSLHIREKTGDRTAVPTTLSNLGDIALFNGDVEQGERYHLEAYDIRCELENDRGIALSCYQLGTVAIIRQDWDRAQFWYEKGKEIADRIGDAYGMASLDLGVGLLQVHFGQLAAAVDSFSKSLASFQVMGAQRMLLEALNGIAHSGVRLGHDVQAVQLISASKALHRTYPLSVLTRKAEWIDAFYDSLRARVGETVWEEAWATGEQWSIEEALDAAEAMLKMPLPGQSQRESKAASDSEATDVVAIQVADLTGRQIEVLRLLARGLSDKDIADELSISPRTAMTHVSNILTRLNVNRRSAAANIAIRAGLIDDPVVAAED